MSELGVRDSEGIWGYEQGRGGTGYTVHPYVSDLSTRTYSHLTHGSDNIVEVKTKRQNSYLIYEKDHSKLRILV